MIYREPAFSRSYDVAPPPTLSCQQVVSVSQSSCVSPVELTDGIGGEEGGGGAKTYDGEKAWSSINHSILSGWSGFKRQLNSVGPLYFFLFYLGEQAM
jgi:hypothetical protein